MGGAGGAEGSAQPEPTLSTGSPVYSLYALCNHSGSVHYGHYTAFCRDPAGWRVYNDSRSVPPEPPTLPRSTPEPPEPCRGC